MFLTDRVSVGAVRRTGDGYLVADAKVARTGIQQYLGSEVGRPDVPIVRVYRPPEEVFSRDAMHSYAHRPITVEHPSKMVDASTWKGVAAGQTGEDVVRDGECVRVPLLLMDAAAIKAYESGKRELSMGYSAEIVFEDGVTPDGQPYDAVQKQLRMNHLALVDRARGGAELRIGDGRTPGGSDTRAVNPTRIHSMNEIKTRTVMVDGLPVECTDAAAIAIDKLQRQIQDGVNREQDARIEHQRAIEAKDEEIGKLKGENKTLQDAQIKPEDLDRLASARAELISDAKALAPNITTTGIADADIRKAAVEAVHGAEFVKDASPAEIAGMFRVLTKDAKKDPVARALRDGVPARTAVNDNGYAESVAALNRTQKEA